MRLCSSACTAASPCDFDAWGYASSLVAAPLLVVAVILIAGVAGASRDDDAFMEALALRDMLRRGGAASARWSAAQGRLGEVSGRLSASPAELDAALDLH